MNVRTAETYLACHRAGMRMSGPVAAALKMAESDELMRAQLEAQAAFDTQMMGAIHLIRPPESLRKTIAECATPPKLRKHARHPTILCAIAGVLLAIGFGVYLLIEHLAGFPGKENAERMVAQLGHMSGIELEPKRDTVAGLADWFMLRGFDGMAVPPDLGALPAVGARTFQNAGHTVGQIAIDKHETILNVFRASDFGVRLGQEDGWKVFEQDAWAAAIRQRGDVCTLLAFHGSAGEMEEFVASLQP